MTSLPPHRAAFSSVMLFSSGVVLGGMSMAGGFFLSDLRAAPEAEAGVESTLELVSGMSDADRAPSSRTTPAAQTPPSEPARVEPEAPRPRNATGAIERALSFAVSVRAGPSYGAGTLVAEGAILTALHVVEGRPAPQVRFQDGDWSEAEVVATDSEADMALLRVEGSAGRAPAPMASALDLEIGEPLVSVGSPRELSFTVHRGDVSYVGRRFGRVRYLQTDLPANPGSSGGPVVDEEGRLIGIMAFILRESEGIAFVTPVDYAAGVFSRADVSLGPLTSSQPAFEEWRNDRTR